MDAASAECSEDTQDRPVEPAGAAVAVFLEAFEPLKRIVAGLGLGYADAQDVLQDVYLQASRRTKPLPAGEARAWLVRVTVNRALLEHRRRKRFANSAERMARDRAAPPAPPPDAAAAHAEELQAMCELMRELDEALLVPLALRYFSGMDSTQIGRALDLPPATVRRRVHDARLILARRLIERGFEP